MKTFHFLQQLTLIFVSLHIYQFIEIKSTVASAYPPRDETEDFTEMVDYTLKYAEKTRFSIALSGNAACETVNKYYKDQIFYVYDLSHCTEEKLDETCEFTSINEAVMKAYEGRKSKGRNIAVFKNAHALKECEEITNFNAIWPLVDGSSYENINVLLLFEENFPRDDYPENEKIMGHIVSQQSKCRNIFYREDFNPVAFMSRLTAFHVEQEPQSKYCSIVIPESNLSIPGSKFFHEINPVLLIGTVFSIIASTIAIFFKKASAIAIFFKNLIQNSIFFNSIQNFIKDCSERKNTENFEAKVGDSINTIHNTDEYGDENHVSKRGPGTPKEKKQSKTEPKQKKKK